MNPLRLTAFASSPEGGALSICRLGAKKAPPFGGAGIEQSEMTERVSPPREAGAAFLAPGQIAKIDFRGTGRFCVDLHFEVC